MNNMAVLINMAVLTDMVVLNEQHGCADSRADLLEPRHYGCSFMLLKSTFVSPLPQEHFLKFYLISSFCFS